MREAVLQFRWSRPLCGVEVVQGCPLDETTSIFAVATDGMPNVPRSCLVAKDEEFDYAEEDYFEYGVDFRRELLRTSPNDEQAIKRCAALYGFLTGPLRHPIEEVLPENFGLGPGLKQIVMRSGERRWGEELAIWRECIGFHRLVDAMYQGLREGNADLLRREERALDINFKDASYELLWKLGSKKGGGYVMGDWKNFLSFLDVRLERAILRMIRDRDGACELVQSAIDLEAFSWLLFAQDLANGRAPIRCECCGNQFWPHSRSKPGHARFCGDSCRVTQSRRRKKAKSLLEEGRSPRQIAHRLGLKTSQVRQLVEGN